MSTSNLLLTYFGFSINNNNEELDVSELLTRPHTATIIDSDDVLAT